MFLLTCSLPEQSGMDAAPLLSLERGQDAERCSSALLRSWKDHRLSEYSLLVSFSPYLPSSPTTGIVCPLPHCSSLSQAEDSFITWVMFASISPKPISALRHAESLGGCAGHRRPQRYSRSPQVTVRGWARLLFFTLTGVWMHPYAGKMGEKNWSPQMASMCLVFKINSLHAALVTRGYGAGMGPGWFCVWSIYLPGLCSSLGCAYHKGMLGKPVTHLNMVPRLSCALGEGGRFLM